MNILKGVHRMEQLVHPLMISFSYLHHLTFTHTLVASTAAVHENLSGGLQT